MAWTAPKVDWAAVDVVINTDLNAIGNDLLYLKDHESDTTEPVHGSASAATALKLIHRDAAGRAKVADPAAADDIATKGTVDAEAGLRGGADVVLQAAIDAVEAGYLPLAGGVMVGGVQGHVGTDYTTGRFRNVFLSTASPTTEGANGDVWMQYLP